MPVQVDDFVYPDFEEVLACYAAANACSLERARERMRPDGRGLVEGSLGRASNHRVYSGADLALQAAVMGHGIAETQAFYDGNKRTAALVVAFFLAINGYDLLAPDEVLASWFIMISQGLSEQDLADRMRPYMREKWRPSA